MSCTCPALCREYISEFGTILHHNVDKGLIIGGASSATFGSARITKKIEVIITGRATSDVNGRSLDVNNIASEVAVDYFRKNTRFLDLENELSVESRIAKGSSDLSSLFERGKSDVPLANDTSFGIGFAPFTLTESLVLESEHYLNSKEYKASMPAVGEDIKVMGLRERNGITLTIAVAFVSKFVDSLEKYIEFKERVERDVINNAKRITKEDIKAHVNTGDSLERGEVYLTKSGLSCEAGDDGSVGRGNRVNGLITPFRHMSLEAAAGKNPISHIGKIYNIMSTEMARKITEDYPEIKECDIAILSQIGRKISDPHNLNINLITEDGSDFNSVSGKARYVAEGFLENTAQLTLDISLGKYKTF